MTAIASTTASTARRVVWWPWLVLSVFVVIAIAGTTLISLNGESVLEQLPYLIAFTVFGATGALILSRDPRNVIGGLLLFASMATAGSFASGEILTWLVTHGHTTGPLVVVCGVLSGVGWLYGILLTLFLLPLLFPDGHVPSPRWRPYLWAIVGFVVLLTPFLVFGSETFTGSSDAAEVPNPLYIAALGKVPNLDPVIGILYPTLLITSVVSLVVRFRSAGIEERQQIKWAVFGFSVAVIGIIASELLDTAGGEVTLSAIVGGTAFLIFPASIGISVLRFRLYDLDVVVKKTLLSGTVVVLVMAVYALVVAAINAWAGNAEGARVAGAAVAGLCLWPSLVLARRVADRLVYGRRASAYEVLTEFSERLGGAYATEDVLQRMVTTLGEGTGAQQATVWLFVDGRFQPSAIWPSTAPQPSPVDTSTVGSLPGDATAEVRDKGELLGALSVSMPASDPITPTRGKLLNDLATQAGLALRNVRLVEGMRGLQRRLVAAQDEERRKLERNIHDGVQQQLVALNVQLSLLEKVVDRDPAKAGAMTGALQIRATEALEDLRNLARGIYPPLLADKGLVAALESQSRKAAVPTSVVADGIGRYDRAAESAVYFCSLEALNNTAKYADANAATVTLAQTDGRLTFTVADDGRGFDPSATAYGTGLQGMADRLAAIGGELQVRSELDRGTTITGSIPVEASA